MRLPLVALALLLAPAFGAIAADKLSCPDLSTAVRVGSCPSDEELKYTFMGYCGDNARLYGRDGDTCESFENYRRVKNTALWESADGAFSAYLSCALPEAGWRASQPTRIAVERKGSLTRVVCDYQDGVSFTHRGKAACVVEGDGSCSSPANCQVRCD